MVLTVFMGLGALRELLRFASLPLHFVLISLAIRIIALCWSGLWLRLRRG